MDGLLLDTEDLYTLCINKVLSKYERPSLPWSIKAQLQGRPGPQANEIFHQWACLPVPEEQYLAEYSAIQEQYFPTAKPLPGVADLLSALDSTKNTNATTATTNGADPSSQQRIHLALATSSNTKNVRLKTSHLDPSLFAVFPPPRQVRGDDPRIAPGRGKPLPDIYLLALETINASLEPGETPVKPEECLVFEDSVPGVEAGRRAGMQVVWVPHPMLKKEYEGQEAAVLAGRTGCAGREGKGTDEKSGVEKLGTEGDDWAVELDNLVGFPYERFGIRVSK